MTVVPLVSVAGVRPIPAPAPNAEPSTVWKYQLHPGKPTTIRMPVGATVLTVAPQGPDDVFLWVLVRPDAPSMDCQFESYGTGDPIPDPPQGVAREHVGTFQLHGDVFHVFELVAP